MKKFLLLLFSMFATLCFFSCDDASKIEKYYLDPNGILVVQYDDGETESLGRLTDTIANGVENIEINADGYYVINNIVTDIKAKCPQSYSIDTDGNLIVRYTDTTTENLGKFGSDSINTIDKISISDDGFYVLNGIKTDIVAVEVFDVTFETGYNEKVSKQTIKDGYKVERPKIERAGYTLNGWYCNGEEWRFNSDVVKNDMTLTVEWSANEYIVSFVTGIDGTESPITVTYDSEYTLPELEQTGYTFDGWLYNGKLVTADKWDIDEDCTLTAKWTVNKYTVSLNANGGNVSVASKKIEYGKPFTLPVATNSYGAFIGWFYNGEQITDSNGNSLSNWTYTTDIEVTTSWTIELSSVEDLQQLYNYPNGHFELTNSLDISLIEWEPIGTETRPFTGQIDGGNFIINGLKITQLQENQKYYGLIGYAQSGKIFNLGLTNVNINLPAISNTIYVGGVIAKNENAMLENITVSGSISIANHSSSYESYAGGLIGYSSTDDVKSCINSANITAKSVAGGLIGYKKATAEINHFVGNKNSGNISANIAGGLIGDGVLCFAFECENKGGIIGKNYAGGIIGRSDLLSVVESCLNIGNITTISDTNYLYEGAGGIIGAIISSTYIELAVQITNSYNTGNIMGHYNAGGIVGASANNKTTIQNSYNCGNIDGNWYIGGIAGLNIGITIRQCFNSGKITSDNLSAIFSFTLPSYTCTITDCYYNCSTSSVSQLQGTETTEDYSATFYTEQLFWDNSVWDFHTDKMPTLKMESVFNN
ncbi:MAG: hypothetical protein E7364_04685 [Clostridiales bacterium]|nr:hypothetical protein [Clostridiales bacterium]